jgi:hypothetical protein
MLPKQEKLVLSEYTGIYDIVIKKDHWIRELHDIIDYDFIFDELKDKYCDDNGAMAYNPIAMFKLLMLKSKYDLSDRDLIERGESDMAIKFFLDISPEEPMPHHSLLTKFRKLRLNDETLLQKLIAKTILKAQEKGLIKTKMIIVDSTHTTSVYHPRTPIEILQEESKKLRKAVYKIKSGYKEKMPSKPTSQDLDDHISYSNQLITLLRNDESLSFYNDIKEKINYLEEIVNDDIEHKISIFDEEAKIGHKTSDSSFFGYKTHLAMSPERIITAAVISSGEKTDNEFTQQLIEQSQENGYDVDTLIGDGAYSGKKDLEYGQKNEIKIVSKTNEYVYNGNPNTRKCHGFTFNKDAGMYVCTAGQIAIKRVKNGGKKNPEKAQQTTFFFDVKKCQQCSLKDGCYKEGSRTKTYTFRKPSKLHQDQVDFQNSEEFKLLYKERYKIEAKHSELKNNHDMGKTHTSGLFGMQLQALVTIFTVNLKRIITLDEEKRQK